MTSNLAAILLHREISGRRNYKPSIELLLESSYFANSDQKHLAEDFPLNDTGETLTTYTQTCILPCAEIDMLGHVHILILASMSWFVIGY
jgi:hypothetical protein